MITDSLDDVADSTDWLSTPLSGLAAVEAALRCQVCKDFYKTPMLTSCNHTFCSVCIRRALSNDGKCPLCRASEQELKLRSNWSMEETVDTFVKTRQDVLDFARRPAMIAAAPDSPKRKRGEFYDEEEEQTTSSSQRSSKRLRSSTRLSKSRSVETTAEMARQEAEIQDSDDDEADDYEPDDGLVACPVCLQRMKENLVFQHLDTSCPGGPQPQPKRSRNSNSRLTRPPNSTSFPSRSSALPPLPQPQLQPPKNLERLPAIHYSMLKEPQLRKKLQELGISAGGTRQMLERRHKEWVTLWNANCDALHPRRKVDLLHDLDAWERTLGTRAPTASRSLQLGAQIKDKDFDGAAWAAKHDDSFKDLIASARKNNKSKTQAQAQEEGKAESAGQGQPQREQQQGDPGLPAPGYEAVVANESQEPTAIPPPPIGVDAPVPSYVIPAMPTDSAIVDLTRDDPAAAAAVPDGPYRMPPPLNRAGVPDGSYMMPPLRSASATGENSFPPRVDPDYPSYPHLF